MKTPNRSPTRSNRIEARHVSLLDERIAGTSNRSSPGPLNGATSLTLNSTFGVPPAGQNVDDGSKDAARFRPVRRAGLSLIIGPTAVELARSSRHASEKCPLDGIVANQYLGGAGVDYSILEARPYLAVSRTSSGKQLAKWDNDRRCAQSAPYGFTAGRRYRGILWVQVAGNDSYDKSIQFEAPRLLRLAA
jgi:hypothetical protein